MSHFSRNGIFVSEEEARRIDSGTDEDESDRDTIPPELTESAKGFILRTEKRANDIVNAARQEADSIVKDADEKASIIVNAARQEADSIVKAAEEKASTVKTEVS